MAQRQKAVLAYIITSKCVLPDPFRKPPRFVLRGARQELNPSLGPSGFPPRGLEKKAAAILDTLGIVTGVGTSYGSFFKCLPPVDEIQVTWTYIVLSCFHCMIFGGGYQGFIGITMQVLLILPADGKVPLSFACRFAER